MAAADYEVSSSYLDAVLRALGRQALPAILEAVDPVARPTIENAWSAPWHPALHLEAFGEAVVKLHGEQAFEDLAYRAMKDRFGAIVLPMFKRSLEETQRSPAAILSKLSGVLEVGLRGLDLGWKADPGGGMLQIRYPRPVAAHVDRSWRGVLRFIFEVTQSGRIADFLQSGDGKVLQYSLEW